MSHVVHINKSRRTYEWVMSHIRMDPVAHINELCRRYKLVTSHMRISHVAHMNQSRHVRHSMPASMSHTNASYLPYEWVMPHLWTRHMGWLRLVGFLKLYVSFAEYSLFYRSFLQKRPTILRSLLIVANPYHVRHSLLVSMSPWHRNASHMPFQWVQMYEENMGEGDPNRIVYLTICAGWQPLHRVI